MADSAAASPTASPRPPVRSWGDWWLAGQAAATLLGIRAALTVAPTLRVRRLIEGARVAETTDRARQLVRVRWAVAAASRRLPRTTCLHEALAGALLARRLAGVAPTIAYGGRRETSGFRGHAWLEWNDEALVGYQGEHERFEPVRGASCTT